MHKMGVERGRVTAQTCVDIGEISFSNLSNFYNLGLMYKYKYLKSDGIFSTPATKKSSHRFLSSDSYTAFLPTDEVAGRARCPGGALMKSTAGVACCFHPRHQE